MAVRFRSSRTSAAALSVVLFTAIVASACFGGSGSSTPKATPTPNVPGPIDAIAAWVQQNRNVGFVGLCSNAKQGVDLGKLCVSLVGTRGTRQAYNLGPTFSDPTALALVEQGTAGWTVLSVTNNDPSQPSVPGIAWPLQVGDQVVVIGLGPGDCLRVRDQPTQKGKQLNCVPDGTKAIIQEGPTTAETFTWWKIAGDLSGTGFNGWAAGTWLRLPDAIAQALNPPTPVTTTAPAATPTPKR
ncbi:MAG TPA: hypothetical protein VEZ14_13345 [Dehalococcoidia bacterium]|nr:hypothetical protein [Dehalococcoidia bacterium]